MKFYIKIVLFFLLASCAKKGSPDGGPKDEAAPIMVTANPPYKTINFNKKEIRFYFDEYIVLKELNKKLIISPPLKNAPLITPQGTATKYLNIEILDTLKANTTYTFNFGDAIQDNNENNKLENFKYIFSTGSYIDSLSTRGTVTDALKGKLAKNISIVLYELDSVYNDSTFYKSKPTYVTNTLDSVNFEFTNLKKGHYKMMALDEESSDYIFKSNTDGVGFLPDTITLPKDSIVKKSFSIFKEEQPYKFKKGKQVTAGKIQFGFTGKQSNLKALLTTKVSKEFKSFSKLEKEKDTLNYWFTPVELDSLNFIVSNKESLDTITVKLKKKEIDSLVVSSSVNGNLHLLDTLFLNTNNPIKDVNKEMFSLSVDSILIDYKLDKVDVNKLSLFFKKEPKTSYKLSVFPNAIVDLYETTNDTLKYKFNTKEKEDYGSISLKVEKETISPVIIQLLVKDKVIRAKYVQKSSEVVFDLLEPKEYSIRAIVDDNKNNVWDTGSFLRGLQPEKIIYFNKLIELRANWVINENFVIY